MWPENQKRVQNPSGSRRLAHVVDGLDAVSAHSVKSFDERHKPIPQKREVVILGQRNDLAARETDVLPRAMWMLLLRGMSVQRQQRRL
jgi:hypothetical protein